MSSRKSSASSSRRQSSSSVIMSRRGSYSVVKEELEEERQSPQGVAELEINLRQQLEEQIRERLTIVIGNNCDNDVRRPCKRKRLNVTNLTTSLITEYFQKT